ncbi:MAG: TrbC/VirB2 family protein [bacterium]|nr:TrbC/VirB2 family protein [bacterium]
MLRRFLRGGARWALALPALVLVADLSAATAGTDPWSVGVVALQALFTGAIARGLSIVCVVIAGLTFAFGEGQSKKQLAGVVFGLGMALGATSFLTWVTGSTVAATTIEQAAEVGAGLE